MQPLMRDKEGWMEKHLTHVDSHREIVDVVLYGDSIVKNYGSNWKKAFGKDILNFGIGGDKCENVLYRLVNGRIPIHAKIAIVHVGTNNVSSKHATAQMIADGICQICKTIKKFRGDIDIIVSGILPGKDRELSKVCKVNQLLKRIFKRNNYRTFYVSPNCQDWIVNDQLNPDLYSSDQIHLSSLGYPRLISHIQKISKLTTLPLYPDTGRDCTLSDPFRHLRLGIMEELDGVEEPPPMWNPRFPPVSRGYSYSSKNRKKKCGRK